MINKGALVGRLVEDPKLTYTPAGKPVANFKVASARPYKDQSGNKPTDFIPCVLWGEQGEFIANNGKKGAMVGCSGRYESRSYDHPQHPIKVYVIELNCEEVQLLDWDNDSQGSSGGSQGGYNQGGGYNNPQGQQNNNRGGSQSSYNQNNNQGGYNRNNSQQQNSGGYNRNNSQQQGGYNQNNNQGGYGGQQQGGGYGNQGGYNNNNNPFSDGKPIDISDDDLPF